jgi:hypothetical protein
MKKKKETPFIEVVGVDAPIGDHMRDKVTQKSQVLISRKSLPKCVGYKYPGPFRSQNSPLA